MLPVVDRTQSALLLVMIGAAATHSKRLADDYALIGVLEFGVVAYVLVHELTVVFR